MSESAKSATERLEQALEAIAASRALNIWSFIDYERAQASAAASVQRHHKGQALGPLDGALIAVKGNIAVEHWPLEGGLAVRRGLQANEDAPVIARLRETGAVLLGQTHMDAGALGATGRSIAGPIGLPGAPNLSVGGSSGGSAAAVAAGHCDYALGTDTIGSVRIPAALAGITACKPTFGLLSTAAVLPVQASFDHVGPMARDLTRLGVFFNELSQPLDNSAALARAPLRIAALHGMESLGLATEVTHAYEQALAQLSAAGHTLTRIDASSFDLSRVRRAVFSLCEHSMWLAHREHLDTRAHDYDADLLSMLQYGSRLDTAKLQTLANQIAAFESHWRVVSCDFDLVLSPTSPVVAFAHSGESPTHIADLTVIASVSGQPALTLPLAAGTLPVGLQLIGQHNKDHALFGAAQQLSALLLTGQLSS